jgi:putative transposase
MKRSRTGSSAGKAPAVSPVATVQVPLPLLAVLADAKTAFFGLCLTAGQQVFQTLMEQDRAQLCGPKNVPDPDRQAYRGGSAPSEVVLGGRRIVLPRLRARRVTGEELTLPSFAYASARDPLDARTLEAIAVGVTTRKYPRTLEPLRPDITERAVSKSAVSRRFVALTSARLTTWLATPLEALDIRVVLIDGLHFRDHVILLALGLDAQGTKHVLALREGTTENATVCKALLADLRERGLDLDRPTLFIIDGGSGLRKAIRETSGTLGLVQRCQVHKARNVLEHLPEALRPRIRRALNEAYGLADATLAKRRLTQLADGLERTHPGAAASLREGLDETLWSLPSRWAAIAATPSINSSKSTRFFRPIGLPLPRPQPVGCADLALRVDCCSEGALLGRREVGQLVLVVEKIEVSKRDLPRSSSARRPAFRNENGPGRELRAMREVRLRASGSVRAARDRRTTREDKTHKGGICPDRLLPPRRPSVTAARQS